MTTKNEKKESELIEKFFKCGLNSASTIEELHQLNRSIPPEKLDGMIYFQTFVDLFIDRAKGITKEKTKSEDKENYEKDALKKLKERLELLQYRLTEVTTHHWTNKRKRQIRSVVQDTFPELEIRQYTSAEVKKLSIDPRDNDGS